ncbi:MAG: UDP-glucose 4-epimerase [Candidatus Xenobia bacterium]
MDLKDKRIVLIGGAGLIGSHLCDLLVEEPVREVVVLDNFVRGRRENLARASQSPKLTIIEQSMTDSDAVQKALEGAHGVFLLASLWLGECLDEPRAAWETNVLGSWNVVEACQKLGVERLVYSSSASVYGDALVTPMTEQHPFNNRNTYGATKIACEQMLRAIHDQHGLAYVGLRYMNVYGPRMDYRGAYVSVIMRVLDRIFAGQPPLIHGDGSQTYDFIYVEDAARANLLAMQAECSDVFLNVGSGQGTSLNELVARLLELTGSPLEPQYQPQTQSLVTQRVGSTELAERLLGFRASTPLAEGLERVLAWRRVEELAS